MAVILSAPRAWGKTRYKESLRKHFGCDRVIDDWNYQGASLRRFKGNPLVLTERVVRGELPPGSTVVSGGEADAALRAVGGEPFGGRK